MAPFTFAAVVISVGLCLALLRPSCRVTSTIALIVVGALLEIRFSFTGNGRAAARPHIAERQERPQCPPERIKIQQPLSPGHARVARTFSVAREAAGKEATARAVARAAAKEAAAAMAAFQAQRAVTRSRAKV